MRNTLKFIAVVAFTLSVGASSLALGETTGQFIDDATITTKVKAALLSDSKLKATKVSVETNKGTVQLSGSVENSDQKAEALRVANEVNGVKSVKDNLTVRTTQED